MLIYANLCIRFWLRWSGNKVRIGSGILDARTYITYEPDEGDIYPVSLVSLSGWTNTTVIYETEEQNCKDYLEVHILRSQ
jgi:hypothetical protein